ncbi:cell division protein FtsL [Paenibacillus sp. DS2015]|uniref:hypothetical protein n=1 Tax=Paenibacillus sp. DS2015 TaxID=3373917 RepID=UPI003D204EF4
MAYTRGNLAVKPKPIERVSPGYREQTKVITRRATLPMKEKMLYLLTVVICVAVAGLIISRYANIYDINKQSEKLGEEIRKNQLLVTQLEVKKETLKNTILATAIKEGYVEPTEHDTVYVPRSMVTPEKEISNIDSAQK